MKLKEDMEFRKNLLLWNLFCWRLHTLSYSIIWEMGKDFRATILPWLQMTS